MSKEKQSIRVTIRVRPMSEKDLLEDSRVCVKVEQETHSITIGQGNEAKKFAFDQICENQTQQNMFYKVGKTSAEFCLQGYNSTIFAYGQTGAGKTFTMMGVPYEDKNHEQLQGIIPRTLQYLFDRIEEEIETYGTEYLIKCYFLQIYNEQMIDLLNKQNSNVKIRQSVNGVFIEGIEEFTISKPDQAMELLKRGSRGRHVGSTCYNQTSSRSHSVFTMHIESKMVKNGVANTKRRYFHFVDLAGSQRTKMSMGQRLKQGCSINKSLHVLGKVINSLADFTEGKAQHVNYRDSKLTFLLKDSLSGNSKTHLIANIHAGQNAYYQTISTLAFARRVKLIKLKKAEINEQASGNLQSLKSQIRRLKEEIIRLKSGSTIADFISSPNKNNQNNSQQETHMNQKMKGILHQYVSEQLEKDTKLQNELSKLQARVNYLQEGIGKYSDNQKHLKMIISIYEDKFKRTKQIEIKLNQKIQEINPESQQARLLKQYFENERENYLQEIKNLRQLVLNNKNSSALMKRVLQQSSAFKQAEQTQQGIIEVLSKNNQFLSEIKDIISEEMQGKGAGDKNLGIQIDRLHRQFQMKEKELIEKIEQVSLENIELKNNNEDTQVLLRQAVDIQLTLQSEKNTLKNENESLKAQVQQLNEKFIEFQAKQEKAKVQYEQAIASLTVSLADSQNQYLQSKNQILSLKQKIELLQHNANQEQQQTNKFAEKLERTVTQKQQEIHSLRNSLVKFEVQIKGLVNEKEEISANLQIKNDACKLLQRQRQEAEAKFEQLKRQAELKLTEANQKIQLKEKQIIEKEDTIKQREQQLQSLRNQAEQMSERWALEKANFEQELQILSNKSSQLNRVLNQKQLTGNEAHDKLNAIQMQNLRLQNRINEIEKKAESEKRDLSDTIKKLNKKKQELGAQLSTLKQQFETTKSECKSLTALVQSTKQQNLHQANDLKLLEADYTDLENKHESAKQQLIEIKERQKALKVNLTTLENQRYVDQKNHEIELDGVKELIRQKETSIEHLQRELHKTKQVMSKTVGDLKGEIEYQRELFKASEDSIKKAMESHLSNKEHKITELKALQFSLTQQLNQLKLQAEQRIAQLRQKQNTISELKAANGHVEQQLVQVSRDLAVSMEELEQTKMEHQRQMEQSEISHNEQIDQKNQELEKLIAENQTVNLKVQNLAIQLKQSNKKAEESIKKCQELSQQKQEFQEQLANLKEQMESKQLTLQKSSSMIQQFERNSEQTLKNKQQFIVHLQGQIQKIRQLKNQYEADLTETIKTNSQMQRQIDRLEFETTQLKEQKNQFEQSMTKALKKTDGERHLLQDQLKQMDVLYQEKEESFQAKVRQLESAQILIAQLKKQKQVLLLNEKDKMIELARQIERLKDQSFVSSQVIDDTKQQTKFYQEKSEELQKQLSHVKKQNKQLQEKVQQHQSTIKGMKIEIMQVSDTLRKQIKQLESDNKQFEQANGQLRFQIEQIKYLSKEQINSLSNELQMHKKSMSNYVGLSQFNQVKADLNREKRINQQKQATIQRFEEEMSAFHHQMNYQVRQLTNKLLHKEDQLKAIRMQLSRQKEKKMHVEFELNQMMTVANEKAQLEQQLDNFKRKNNQLQSDISNNSSKLSTMRNATHHLESDLEQSKQTIENLKLLISNTESQKCQLELQLQEQKNIYQKMLERIQKNEDESRNQSSSQYYLKTLQMLQKSRSELMESKRQIEQLKRNNKKLKQQIRESQQISKDVQLRAEQFCKNQQNQVSSIQNDYTKLEFQYNQVVKERSAIEQLKDQLKSYKVSSSRSLLKIEELEDRIRYQKNQMNEMQKQNDQLKRHALRSNFDQQRIKKINQLKQQNNSLKNKVEILTEQLNRESQQKIKLKAEKRHSKQNGNISENAFKIQMQKKNQDIKFLQQLIADALNILGLRRNDSRYKGQSIKNHLLVGIKQVINELHTHKEKVKQLEEQMDSQANKLTAMQKQYNTLKVKAKNQTTNNLNNIIKSKISKVDATFAHLRQSVDGDKSPLRNHQLNGSTINKRY